MNSNDLEYQIPDMSRSFQRIRELDLFHQKRSNRRGLSGNIPVSWTNLPDIILLDLSGNDLTGSIPSDIGNLQKIKKLDLSATN